MTTQIHKFHTRDTEEQLYDVPLHDVELNDVANVRHKSASSCVPSWLPQCYSQLYQCLNYEHSKWVGSQTIFNVLTGIIIFLTDLFLPPLLLQWRRSVQYRGRAKPEVFKSPFSADCKRNLTFATLRLFLVCVSSPALLVELQYGLSIDPRSLCP